MKRLLIAFLFLLPFQAHAVFMRAVATGTVIDSEDETGQFGYGTTVSNPLEGATVLASWSFYTEEAGPVSTSATGSRWQPMTNWIHSVLIVRPSDPTEPELKFYDLGGPTARVKGANTFADYMDLQDQTPTLPEGTYYDSYWISSWSRFEPSDERYSWSTTARVISYESDLINPERDLTQELVWQPATGDLAIGRAEFREFEGISRLEYELTSFTVSQVPEPGTLGVMGAALFALGFMRRNPLA